MKTRDSLPLFILITITFCLFTPVAAYSQSIPARNHVKVGKSHLEAGRYEQAEKEFLEALKIEGTLSDAQFLLGLTYLCMKRLDDAQSCFEKVIRQEPKFEVAHYYLAQVYLEKKDLKKAREELEYVVKNDPKLMQPYYGLGVICYLEGDLPKSLEWWQKSINLDRNYAPAYYNMALVQHLLKKPDEARLLLDKAIKLKPQNTLYQFSASWIEYLEGKKENALTGFDTLKNTCGDSAIGLVSEGIQEYEKENIDKAIECATKAREKDPQFQYSFILTGMCMEHEENLEEALKSYEEVLTMDPNEARIRENVEKIKAFLQKEEEEKKARSNYPYHEENRTLW
jgi:superkiller protein 3